MISYPIVSIITAAYNVAQYLPKCINSVLMQSYQNIELIIVNDGSTDNTKDILDGFEDEPKVTILHTVNKGVNNARSLAVNKAKGEFIFILDGDDYIPQNAIELLVSKQRETNSDIVDANFVYVDNIDNTTKNTNEYSFNILSNEDYLKLIIDKNALYQTFKLLRKDIYLTIEPLDLSLSEDAVMITRYCLKSNIASKLDSIVYYYYKRSDSTIYSITFNKIKDYLLAFSTINSELTEKKFWRQKRQIRYNMTLFQANHYESLENSKEYISRYLKYSDMFGIFFSGNFSKKTRFALLLSYISVKYANKILR